MGQDGNKQITRKFWRFWRKTANVRRFMKSRAISRLKIKSPEATINGQFATGVPWHSRARSPQIFFCLEGAAVFWGIMAFGISSPSGCCCCFFHQRPHSPVVIWSRPPTNSWTFPTDTHHLWFRLTSHGRVRLQLCKNVLFRLESEVISGFLRGLKNVLKVFD